MRTAAKKTASTNIHFFVKTFSLCRWQNTSIFKACLILFLSCCIQLMMAQWEDAGNAYYRNGKTKFTAAKRGVDTLEIRTYYKNGQLKDSIWLNVANRDEQPFGTNKRYYSNGRLQSIIKYGKNDQEYVSYEYRKNGLLERYTQRPTGLTKFYNRKGKQIREYDYNNLVDVYVPGRYKNGRHLSGTGFLERIKYKEMKLSNPQTQKRIRSGILISLKLKSDTGILTQCLIEGFSKDSIYISRFHYNPNYRRSNDFDILKYDLTQALPLSTIESIYYTRHKNSLRHFGALVAYVVGYDVLFIPLATSPLFIRSVGDGTADLKKVAMAYGALVAVGLPVVYWGKYLLKTTVPKKYDLNSWTTEFPE